MLLELKTRSTNFYLPVFTWRTPEVNSNIRQLLQPRLFAPVNGKLPDTDYEGGTPHKTSLLGLFATPCTPYNSHSFFTVSNSDSVLTTENKHGTESVQT